MMKKIPFFQIDIGEEETEAVKNVVSDGWISGSGPSINKFAKEFASKVGAKYAIPVCNGTCALIASLMAYSRDIRDPHLFNYKIAIPTWTYMATVASAKLIGRYALMDVDKDTFNARKKLIPKDTNIIIIVDVGGLPAYYDDFLYVDKPVIVDSAESVGATYCGKPIGKFLDLHCYSFHAAKIMTTGEGGMITTNDEMLSATINMIVNQGYTRPIKREYVHGRYGLNFRMTTMQAEIGRVQLKKLDKNIAHRREIARIYKDVIGDKVKYQYEYANIKSSYFLFTILVDSLKTRDGLADHLERKKIETRIWRPAHYQPPYIDFGSYPHADYIYNTHLHIPINNLISDEDAKYVGQIIRRYLR